MYEDAKNDGLWHGSKNKHSQAYVWGRIALTINQKFNCECTYKQCADKWGSLKKKYIQIKGNTSKSGSGHDQEKITTTSPLFEDFERLMGSSDLVEAVVEITSVQPGIEKDAIVVELDDKTERKGAE